MKSGTGKQFVNSRETVTEETDAVAKEKPLSGAAPQELLTLPSRHVPPFGQAAMCKVQEVQQGKMKQVGQHTMLQQCTEPQDQQRDASLTPALWPCVAKGILPRQYIKGPDHIPGYHPVTVSC